MAVEWLQRSPNSRPGCVTLIAEGKLPPDYRGWRLISVAQAGSLNDLRAVIGDDLTIEAFREGKLPFPDGAIIARLAWILSRRRRTTKRLAVPNPSSLGFQRRGSVHGQGFEQIRLKNG
jgi:Cytochrome P460